MPHDRGAAQPDDSLRARDVVAFGQEIGRVLSSGRIVGRAEPFAKVFSSSRGVKRAVGPTAWVILEDIALSARLDPEGRLVADTNIRRIGRNLGLSKNTVTKHLARLRDHGFVLAEEVRAQGSGRYETVRYVLDPSACIERFTLTPELTREADRSTAHSELTGCSPTTAASTPGPSQNQARESHSPRRPKNWDTVRARSQEAGHRDLGHKNKKVVVRGEQPQHAATLEAQARLAALTERLVRLGVSQATASTLVGSHPPERVLEALDALDVLDGDEVRSPAGWVVAAVREGWDLGPLLTERREAEARRQRLDREAAIQRDAQAAEQERATTTSRWCAAISAALDDVPLATAVEAVTTAVPGLNRRVPPAVRSQLLAWAVAVHKRHPRLPLARALTEDLETGSGQPRPLPAPSAGSPRHRRHPRRPRCASQRPLAAPTGPDVVHPATPTAARCPVSRTVKGAEHGPTSRRPQSS